MKETRVNIHLEAERKQELVKLCKQYVDRDGIITSIMVSL